jgi:hypothetical protein
MVAGDTERPSWAISRRVNEFARLTSPFLVKWRGWLWRRRNLNMLSNFLVFSAWAALGVAEIVGCWLRRLWSILSQGLLIGFSLSDCVLGYAQARMTGGIT